MTRSVTTIIPAVLESDVDLPYRAVRAGIAEAVSLVMHLERRHGGRCVTEVCRVDGYDPDTNSYQLEVLYCRPGRLSTNGHALPPRTEVVAATGSNQRPLFDQQPG